MLQLWTTWALCQGVPEKVLWTSKQPEPLPAKSRYHQRDSAGRIQINTSSSMTSVHRRFIPDAALLDRTVLMHSTNGSHQYPVAAATICIDGREYRQEVAVSDRLPDDALLGTDAPLMPHIVQSLTSVNLEQLEELILQQKQEKNSYAAVTRAQRLQESTTQGSQPPANTDLSGGGDPVIEAPLRTTTGASGEASTHTAQGSLLPANTKQSGRDPVIEAPPRTTTGASSKASAQTAQGSLLPANTEQSSGNPVIEVPPRTTTGASTGEDAPTSDGGPSVTSEEGPSLKLQPGTLFPFTEDVFSQSTKQAATDPRPEEETASIKGRYYIAA